MSVEIKHITFKGCYFSTPMEAVKKFMCPGPCDPDCPLYPAMRLQNGNYAHMCHEEIVTRYPQKVLDAIGCSYQGIETKDPEPDKAEDGNHYVAIIRSGAVRDAQVCEDDELDPVTSEWHDVKEPELYLGIFKGSREEARKKAAEYGCTHLLNIRLIKLD